MSGQITGFAGLTVAAGHLKAAVVAFTQSDLVDDATNQLDTANNANICVATAATPGCGFTITTRTGQIGLLATILDIDTKGTTSSDDDVSRVIGWAYRSGITVADGVDQTAVDLALIDSQAISSATIDFGAPPSALAKVQGIVGLETADGVFELPVLRTPADTAAFGVPSLASVHGSGYRLTAVAETAAGSAGAESVVTLHGLSSPALAASGWLATPTGVTTSRTAASWNAVPAAQITTLEYTQGTQPVTHLVQVLVLDGSTHVALPDLVTLPTGSLDAKLTAIGAAGLDVHNFGLDTDHDKIQHVASVPATVQ